ncbi:NAD(P)H-binding protein [Microlunatus ginsengisoli]|uniref:SDR family oxidoreductase n=1 Tax=Microlunatus ginsengisoli TaxID=363863 RepID=A0ABP7A5W0_9ACTN
MTLSVLVTGATGTVGSRLLPLLTGHDVEIRALARRPAAVVAHHHRIRPIAGDFADSASLDDAMSGVDAVFLACGNGPDQVAHETAVIDAAARAGVGRLVKLSARGAAPDAAVAYWRWHAEIERRLVASGLPAVILRPGFSMANLFAAAEQVRRAGVIAAPAGAAAIAMIDPLDVAAVAAETLVGDGHAGRTYTLTGPSAIDYRAVAQELGRVARRAVAFVDVPPEAAVAGLTGAGLPPFVADQIAAVFAALRSGAQSTTTGDVATLVGRPPRPLADFATETAPIWSAVA